MSDTPEALARMFHETYERLAPEFGYQANMTTRLFNPQSPNGQLMMATCADMRDKLVDAEITRLRAENAQLDVVARACNEQLMAVEKERDRVRLALDVAIAAGKECEGQIAELRAQIERTCTWQSDQDGVYSTECGHAFVFNDGTPEQNNQRFCGYCGGGLIVPAAPDDIYEALR